MEIHLKTGLHRRRKHERHALIRRCSSLLHNSPDGEYLQILTMVASYCVNWKPCFKNCAWYPAHLSTVFTQATLTSGRMWAVRSRVSGGVIACCHDSSMANCGRNACEDSTSISWAGPAAATVYDKNTDNQQRSTYHCCLCSIGQVIPPLEHPYNKEHRYSTMLEDMFKQIKPVLKQHFLQIGLAVHFYPHPRTGHWKHKEWCDTHQIVMVCTFSFIVYI